MTLGELFSQGGTASPASSFTGPVAVVNGVNDLPFCLGNCDSPNDKAAAVKPALYPNLAQEKFGSYLAPLSGHGLNFHYSSQGAFDYIQNFLEDQGVTA